MPPASIHKPIKMIQESTCSTCKIVFEGMLKFIVLILIMRQKYKYLLKNNKYL
jgi:hypothetical protein